MAEMICGSQCHEYLSLTTGGYLLRTTSNVIETSLKLPLNW